MLLRLAAAPSARQQEARPAPKDIVFVVDTSGSMAGAKLNQAKKALEFCVENLNAEDRFEIVRFSTEAEPLFGKLVDADAGQRKRASDFIAALKPIGGTAIADALQTALKMRSEKSERPFVVIFLTDGLATIGAQWDEILAIGAENRRPAAAHLLVRDRHGREHASARSDRGADARVQHPCIWPSEDLGK